MKYLVFLFLLGCSAQKESRVEAPKCVKLEEIKHDYMINPCEVCELRDLPNCDR